MKPIKLFAFLFVVVLAFSKAFSQTTPTPPQILIRLGLLRDVLIFNL